MSGAPTRSNACTEFSVMVGSALRSQPNIILCTEILRFGPGFTKQTHHIRGIEHRLPSPLFVDKGKTQHFQGLARSWAGLLHRAILFLYVPQCTKAGL